MFKNEGPLQIGKVCTPDKLISPKDYRSWKNIASTAYQTKSKWVLIRWQNTRDLDLVRENQIKLLPKAVQVLYGQA
jgi:hypothetical protein